MSSHSISIPTNDDLGLGDAQRAAMSDGDLVGRVVAEAKGEYRVWADGNEYAAECVGRLLGRAAGRGELPAVGDWVTLEATDHQRARVRSLLPRTTKFSRRAAGQHVVEQVVAANVDVVFITVGLDGDFNLRRIERYLAVAWESGATPVVLLTKCDLVQDLAARVDEARSVAGRAEVIATSARAGIGLERLREILGPRVTVAFMGSSGVGKSTVANALLDREAQRTSEVREHDQRGKHTTTHRELFVLPTGALLIDTPGMRELQLWDVSHGLDAAFDDVTALAETCRFRDCGHGAEPGCAVRASLEAGELDRERFASWKKLSDEASRAREALRARARQGGRSKGARGR